MTSSTCAWMPSNPLNADMSVATTECPQLASTCAVAIPMPRAAPVIKTLSAFAIRKSSYVWYLVFYGLVASHRPNRSGTFQDVQPISVLDTARLHRTRATQVAIRSRMSARDLHGKLALTGRGVMGLWSVVISRLKIRTMPPSLPIAIQRWW